MMGILRKWTLFDAAEKVLERQLSENPFYPFQEASPQDQGDDRTPAVFVYSKRLFRFYLFLILVAVSLLFIMIWSSVGGEMEYLVFAIATLVISVYLSVEYYSVSTIVLDPGTEQYSVYRGDMLTATQHCHNIYIRLMSKKPGGTKYPRYYLVLNGWGLVDTVELCRETPNRKKLRQLGHEIALNLDINYFDVHDSSKHHIIRHSPPALKNTSIHKHEE